MSLLPAGFGGTTESYEIAKSLRFRASASAYLSRTPGVAGNRTTWTWSGWVKRGALSQSPFSPLFVSTGSRGTSGFSSYTMLSINSLDRLVLSSYNASGLEVGNTFSTGNFRDPSGWYHIVGVWDTSNATAADRMRLFVNGVRVPYSSTSTPALNLASQVNAAAIHDIGVYVANVNYPLDGYLSEVNFIDGQALTPDSFGEINPDTGVWVPKKYTGTYGTNGFYLPFNDGTNLTNLCLDRSGNANNWTATNVSLTAGVNYDWMDDTPTNNHSTLNNLVAAAANITKANLASGTTAVQGTFNALAINSYWEVTAGGSNVTAGVISGTGTTNTTTVTANKVFAFRLTAAGALDFLNVTDGGSWTSITTGLSGIQFPYGTTAAADWNFGQRPFSGTVPDGYAKLCSRTIQAGTITTSGSFTGNANADGPFVWLNGVPTAMTINGNAVTFATHADRTANGFKIRTSSASYNVSGTNNYTITTTGAAFKNARAQVNP